MSKTQSVAAAACGFFCCAIFVVGLAAPTVYFGYADEDSTCQEGHRAGMILSDWIKVAGWTPIAYTIFIPVVAGLALLTKVEALLISIPILLIIDVFFWIAWWIIGVVILATNENNHCVAEGKGMAVMAIIQLVIGHLRFTYLKVAAALLSSD